MRCVATLANGGGEPSAKKDFETEHSNVFAAPGLPPLIFNCGIRVQQFKVQHVTARDKPIVNKRNSMLATSAQFSQKRAAWRAITAGEFYRRANQFIMSRLYLRQVNAFKQDDAMVEKGPMHGHLFVGMGRR